ncbi:bile acid:sodium symporter [Patescibacteria group bacterium]|nr:bile acid:sodium symporter [Patescibacteria group bacterium]MBU1448865.1 bile acid:sodium symporter [Patescibacteria group bacterium]MBU2613653.1 bile acid:sodium symporter [Patescibacteria group bacterium]
MSLVSRLRSIFAENQIMIVLIALVAGLLFPTVFRPIAPFGAYLLVLIFFTSSLRLSLNELLAYAKDWKMAALAAFFMLVFMPIAMWIPPRVFAEDWALPFLIVGAMPTGMTIALIAEYFGGKTTLALVITAVTSLLAPFTIPLVFKYTVGQDVPIPVLQMFTELLLTIVVPFGVAMLVQRRIPTFVKKHDHAWSQISILAFGILIAGIVADTTQGSTVTLGWDEVGILFVMLAYIGGLVWLAYRMAWWRTAGEKATIALCMIYMNNTLALFIGNKYFPTQNVVPRLVILLMIVNVLLPPLKWFAKRASTPAGATPFKKPILP